MSTSRDVRVRPKETVELGEVRVTNRTANSILVKRTGKGLVVTDCCLEEQACERHASGLGKLTSVNFRAAGFIPSGPPGRSDGLLADVVFTESP